MTMKKLGLIGMVLSGIIALYLSFEATSVVKLWHWFGYTFSMGNPLENIAPKIAFALFLVIHLIGVYKEKQVKA